MTPASPGFDDLDLSRLQRRRSDKWRAYPPDVLPAFVAEMDYDLAPPVREALHAAIDLDDCGYANPAGLAEAFVSFHTERTGHILDPSRVFLVADVMGGADAVLAMHTSPRAGVVINPPVYPPFFEHISRSGRQIVEVPLLLDPSGRWDLDLDGLEAAFAAGARAYLLCNPHNPTGRVFSRAELVAIAELAERYGVLVLADEIHSPLTLPGAAHTPFVSLGEVEAVTLTSASKAFNIPGLKCAVIVAGSESMRRRLSGLSSIYMFGSGLLGVIASEAAWLRGGPWLDVLIGQLDAVRGVFGKLLADRLPLTVYVPPEAGYLGWVDCRAYAPPVASSSDSPASGGPVSLERACLERGRVAVREGGDFGAPGKGFIRVTMATSVPILTSIADRIAVSLQ